MISPRRTLLASAFVALAVSGCGAVAPADLVASIDGEELDEDRFSGYARELAGDDTVVEVDAQLGQQVVGYFLGAELLRADLDALDAGAPPESTELEGFVALRNDFDLALQAWASLPPETLIDDDVAALYASGPGASGVACVSHILVATEDEADEAKALLDEGTDFAELAGAVSTDTGSAANGGSLQCLPTQQFRTQFVPEFVDAALAAEVGVPSDPFESQFGWHIVQIAPIEQLDGPSVAQVRLGTFEDRYDIFVDPRIGMWDPSAILLPTV